MTCKLSTQMSSFVNNNSFTKCVLHQILINFFNRKKYENIKKENGFQFIHLFFVLFFIVENKHIERSLNSMYKFVLQFCDLYYASKTCNKYIVQIMIVYCIWFIVSIL